MRQRVFDMSFSLMIMVIVPERRSQEKVTSAATSLLETKKNAFSSYLRSSVRRTESFPLPEFTMNTANLLEQYRGNGSPFVLEVD